MNDDEKDAVRSAMRHMFEDNLFPYRAVNASVGRGIQRERTEKEWWDQFLPGHSGLTATIEIEPPDRDGVRISYAPDVTGDPRGGEIVRTWVPFDDDGAGAYSPVLLLGRQSMDHFSAVRLSTASHEGSHRFFAIGAGPKDSHGRLSWVDLDHVYRVHIDGMHRTAFTMDRAHFTRVADELYRRYGWAMRD